ncbi:MAG: Fe-S cluster assembly protein SufD [Flavobacteriales bacterium]|nr:Fe-S cluster assembly protein SufD [Flavobacteriales bacterium]MBL6869211.1 Fe-S cluster assembly protein SufD [Flavobacteriales bacterium]
MIIKDLNHNSLLKENSKLDLEALNLGSFPKRKEERWKYTPLRFLKKINFHNQFNFKIEHLNSLGIPKIEGLVIVLENGKFNSSLSNIIDLMDIELLFLNDGDIVNNSQEPSHKDYFTNLNFSFLTEKVVLKIKPNVNINEPINFVNIISDDNCISNTQFNIDIYENSKLHIRQYFLGSSNSKDGFINHRNQVSLKSQSSLTVDKFQDLNQNFNFCNEFIDQEQESKFIMNTFSASGIILRNDVFNNVNGKNCHSELNGVFAPIEKQHFDNHTTINHFVADCKSFENYKGVIKESGVGVFNGKVIVHQDAQKIEAFQKNNNILLDDESKIYSKPELEIYADDVRCSHGSTTGRFDEEALFYLRSRGISVKKSLELMTLGFINEVIEKSNDSAYKEFVLKRLLKD